MFGRVLPAILLLTISITSYGAEYHVFNKLTSAHYFAEGSNVSTGGVMQRMTGKLSFDPQNFATFRAKINIDVNSIFATQLSSFPKCLNSQRYPEIGFEVLSSKPLTGKDFAVVANLQINGVTKPVEFNFAFDNIYFHVMPGDQIELDLYASTKGPINLSDFGLSCGEVTQIKIDQFNLYGLQD
jgi:polyisoprenoid-binding protein YceI